MGDEPDEIHGCPRYEWEHIVRRVIMPTPAFTVALTLATYANTDGTSIYPGNERLAAVTCQGDKTVRRALDWLRRGYLIERVREGSRGGRRAFADEYRLIVPSDLLTRHTLLDPEETPVPVTGDKASRASDHRSDRPVPPVTESGSPVTESPITGQTDRTPTHNQPLPIQDQRDDLVSDVTTRGRLVSTDDDLDQSEGCATCDRRGQFAVCCPDHSLPLCPGCYRMLHTAAVVGRAS